jgi:amino acid adenylation domain-containing protein
MTQLLQDYCSNSEQARPESFAVISESDRLSYQAIEKLSNQLARAIQAGGSGRGSRVAMLLPKTPRTIASILGILKADCVYVPVDLGSPAARALKILDSAEPTLLLVDKEGQVLWDELYTMSAAVRKTPMVWVDDRSSAPATGCTLDIEDVFNFPGGTIDYQNSSADPAYILYTSGSTGEPKGVVITHANVICFIEWARRYFRLHADDRISGHPPLHFDLSVFDIFGAFAAGAELRLVPPALNVSANGIADFIRYSELTQWFSVPSLLTYVAKFDAVRFNDFPSLRRLLWCGEVLPTPILRYWMERLPHVTFTNLYGPTEATIASSFFTLSKLPEPDDAIPIGRACEGEQLFVLDEQFRTTAPGETGTLYIGGKGLSPGYWKDLRRTEAAFLPNPFSVKSSDRIYNTGDLARTDSAGLVYFVGRTDSQIKNRGYRIELGEIEAALHELEEVKEAAVVALQSDNFENSLICCIYSPFPAARVSPTAIKKALRKRLPSHMLPSRWMVSEQLPKNMNGKIDRSLLKKWFMNSA